MSADDPLSPDALFQSAFEFAAIGMALVSPEGKWLRVNRSVCEMVGYTEAELLATDFQTITHPDDHALPPPETIEVADGVFAYVQPDGSWWINNTGFLVGSDAVTAIDASSTERRTRGFLDAIARVTPRPVRTLLNTHHHGDHTNGNCLFGEATIVAHRNCRELMKEQRIGGLEAVFGEVDWGELTVSPPTLTFDEQVELWVDDLGVEVSYIGTPAHTTGDVVA